MTDIYSRINTAHGEGGSHLHRMNPPLFGKDLEDSQGESAGADVDADGIPAPIAQPTVDEQLGAGVEGYTKEAREQTSGDGRPPADNEGAAEVSDDDDSDGEGNSDEPLTVDALVEAHTREELVDLAEQRGVEVKSADTKAEIAEKLIASADPA